MAKHKSIYSCAALLLLCSGCYVNKAMMHPWADDYSPDSQGDYWTPSKKALSVNKSVPLDKIIPSKDNPLTLAEILDIALTNNAISQQTWAQARAAAARYGQSQSSALPDVSAMFEYFRTRASSFFSSTSAGGSTTGASAGTSTGTSSVGSASNNGIYITTFNQWGPQLHLTYTVFDFGKLKATSDAARQSLYFSDFTHNREIQNVIQTLTGDYYDTLYQQELLHALKSDVETANTTLDAASLGFEQGVQNVSDVLQAKTQLLKYEIDFVEQKQAVVKALSQLLSDMGLPASLSITLEQIPDFTPVEEDLPSLEDLIAVAMQSRPDFLAAGSDLKGKEYALKAAKRETYPQLNYLFDLGRTYYSGGFNDVYDYTSSFNISMPIFRGFYYRNNVKEAEANCEESEGKLKEMELELVKQVTTSRSNVSIAFQSLNFSKQYLSSAEEEYRVSLAEYKAGTTDILTVLSAQSSLANARARLAKAVQNWFMSLADLTYAIGASAMPPASISQELP